MILIIFLSIYQNIHNFTNFFHFLIFGEILVFDHILTIFQKVSISLIFLFSTKIPDFKRKVCIGFMILKAKSRLVLKQAILGSFLNILLKSHILATFLILPHRRSPSRSFSLFSSTEGVISPLTCTRPHIYITFISSIVVIYLGVKILPKVIDLRVSIFNYYTTR